MTYVEMIFEGGPLDGSVGADDRDLETYCDVPEDTWPLVLCWYKRTDRTDSRGRLVYEYWYTDEDFFKKSGKNA